MGQLLVARPNSLASPLSACAKASRAPRADHRQHLGHDRHANLRRFSAWLLDEGEIDTDRLLGFKPPRLDVKVVDPLSETYLRALLASCAGRDLRERRDEAVIRFMLETGARAGEAVALEVADVDLPRRDRRGAPREGRSWGFHRRVGQGCVALVRFGAGQAVALAVVEQVAQPLLKPRSRGRDEVAVLSPGAHAPHVAGAAAVRAR